MPRDERWTDNFVQQVEEAVALQAILSSDFSLQKLEDLPDDPEGLYSELDSIKEKGLPNGELTFLALAHPALPQQGIGVQVGDQEPTGHTLNFLPPLTLQLKLPHDYPSTSPPAISLAAPWLSESQAAQLHSRLLDEIRGEKGFPVCYSLVSWLENTALEFLGWQELLKLSDTAIAEASSSQQAAYNKLGAGQKELVDMLVRFNAVRQRQAFQEGTWTCMICFEEVPGTRCVRGAPCPHFFCASCLQSHCKTQLKENRIDMLLCPDPQCKELLQRERCALLLTEDESRRWEESELQATLLKMSDVVFCPRCDAPSIEDTDNSALCSKCHFSFCSLCQSGYHPGQRCMSAALKLQMIKQRMEGRKDVALLRELKRKEEELLSLACIEKMSKPCPVCCAAISRTEGCNKMACINCGTTFCYVCGKHISGYDHFRADGCVLFDDEEVRRWNEMYGGWQQQPGAANAPPPEMPVERDARGMRRCPSCGALNRKADNLNMLTCRGCRAHYCYLCGKAVRRGEASAHFRPSGCKMHSAD